jgi:lycopene cyclase domain-containing protein
MGVLYLLALLSSLGCMVLLDHRFSLFFWRNAPRATLVLLIGVAVFTAWDLLGIGFEVFARGDAIVATGIVLAPEFPLEELIFLTFLCYLTMVLVFGFEGLLARRRRMSERRVTEHRVTERRVTERRVTEPRTRP